MHAVRLVLFWFPENSFLISLKFNLNINNFGVKRIAKIWKRNIFGRKKYKIMIIFSFFFYKWNSNKILLINHYIELFVKYILIWLNRNSIQIFDFWFPDLFNQIKLNCLLSRSIFKILWHTLLNSLMLTCNLWLLIIAFLSSFSV